MSFQLWLAYLTLCILFAATPGPAVLLTAGQAIARGFKAGIGVVLGIQLGNLIYFTLTATGLGAILMASETAFLFVKYVGATYLIYLGLRTIWNAKKAILPAHGNRVALWQHPFTQGLLNQLANPKSIFFWGAFVPQFVDYKSGTLVLQFTILAVTAIANDTIILSVYAGLAARGGKFIGSGPLALWRERLSGTALIVVGGSLSLVKRGG